MLWNFKYYKCSLDYHIRERIPRIKARDDGSIDDDPFEDQGCNDEDIDFAEYSDPVNLVSQKSNKSSYNSTKIFIYPTHL